MRRACVALGLPRATAYRHLHPRCGPCARPRRASHRRLSPAERETVLEVLDSERFLDQPPREVFATLLGEGQFFCSVRTMYRILRERGAVHDRRDHRERGRHAVPRLTATAPNQVWTWDISKLATVARGDFLNLYVVLDLFSRYVVAWMVAAHENSALAKQLFAEAILRYGIRAGELLVHQDRGAPMTAHGFQDLLAELGVGRSYSRPRVSNDNAFSEAHFHTLKYQPDYPGHFQDLGHARRWCADFFHWYNDEHHHDGLALFRPVDVFSGRVTEIAQCREAALADAYVRHPERFVRGAPVVHLPPPVVTLNRLDPTEPVVTAEQLLAARDALLATTPSPATRPSTAPVIHLPGVHHPNRGAEPESVFAT